MEVAVLGCGPAGLMAAHAATVEGHEVKVFSEKTKSQLGGAQYLHEAIEGVTGEDPDMEVRYMKFGDGETYAHKVYGRPDVGSSFDYSETGWRPAWSLRDAYDRLWGIYSDRIEDLTVDLALLPAIKAQYELVISSIPAFHLCEDRGNGTGFGHDFLSQGIYLQPASFAPENTIIYSGRWSEPWYRTSTIRGEGWTEYSKYNAQRAREALSGSEHISGRKPTGNNCNCHPEIARVGRFGTWRRGVLTHHAFRDALKLVSISGKVVR